jgi:hypothetical protein
VVRGSLYDFSSVSVILISCFGDSRW